MKKILTFLGLVSIAFTAYANDMSEAAIKERIKPVGEVTIKGEIVKTAPKKVEAAPETEPAQETAEAPATADNSAAKGKYATSCVACHGSGVMGAPKLGDKAAWEPRVAKGIDTLYQSAIKGINTMPPKGGCGNCSDDDLKAIVDYMVAEAK